MKRLLLAIIAVLFLISCRPTYVFYVKSNTKSNDSLFVFENDTIRITYHLWQNRGRMHFAIYNKLDVPIFLDWKNSSFIMNDVPKQYWEDETKTKSRNRITSFDYIYPLIILQNPDIPPQFDQLIHNNLDPII